MQICRYYINKMYRYRTEFSIQIYTEGMSILFGIANRFKKPVTKKKTLKLHVIRNCLKRSVTIFFHLNAFARKTQHNYQKKETSEFEHL